MKLLDLQRKMLTAVTQPLTASEGMRTRMLDGRSMQVESASFIKPNDRLTSFERLELYNRQYWFRLLSAMSEDFPGVIVLIGDRQFERLVIEYLRAHPSRSFTLRNLGSNFEQWISTCTAKLAVNRAILMDVARLEWAHIEAFDNAELPALSATDMQSLGEGSCLGLQPHLRLIAVHYPVDNLVVAAHQAQNEPEMASNAFTSPKHSSRRRNVRNLQPEELHLAVHRFDESVYYKRLDVDAYRILVRIRLGFPLGEALKGAAAESQVESDAFAANTQAWFANWSNLGWLTLPSHRPSSSRLRSPDLKRKR